MKFLSAFIIFIFSVAMSYGQSDTTVKESNMRILKISPLALTHKIAIHYEDQFKATNYSWGVGLGFHYPMIGNNMSPYSLSESTIEWAVKLEFVGKRYWNPKKVLSGFYTYGKTGLSCMSYKTQYSNNPNSSTTTYYGLSNRTIAVSAGLGLGIGYQNFLGKNKRWVYDLGLGLQYWLSGIQGNAPYTNSDEQWIDITGPGSIINANFRIGYVLKK